jgi:acyl-coenzyme A thioesterase PaaI-like protein
MRRRVEVPQNVSRMCFVCGIDNPAGLTACFYELDGDELLGVFSPLDEHQSYPGRMHGGVISSLLDETIGRAINMVDRGVWGVTIEFTVKYRRPVPLDRQLKVLGRITKNTTRGFEGTGEILLPDGAVAAEGRGRYLKLPIDQIIGDASLDENWFPDPRPAPSEVEI